MPNRTVATVVLVVLVATAAGFATIAAGETTNLQLGDRYAQSDQQVALTANATPGANVTFGINADGNDTIEQHEIVATVQANASGVATTSAKLSNFTLTEGSVYVTADQATANEYPKTSWEIAKDGTTHELIIDDTPPEFSDRRPLGDHRDATPMISVNITDAYQAVDTENATVMLTDANDTRLHNATPGHAAVEFSGPTLYINTSRLNAPLAEGMVTATVTASDADGIQNTTQWTFTVDTTAPRLRDATLTDATDSDGIVNDGDTISLTATVRDANTRLVWANASAYGAGIVTLTHQQGDTYKTQFQVDGTNTAGDGHHRLTVHALDHAGNANTSTTTPLALDTTAPTFGIPDPVRGGAVNDTAPTISIPISDAHDISATVTITDSIGTVIDEPLTHSALAYANDTLTVNVSATNTTLEPGPVAVTVDAQDPEENQNSTTWNFTVDTTSPTIQSVSLDDGGDSEATDGDTVTVNASVIDATLDTVTVDATAFGAGTIMLTKATNSTYTGSFTVDLAGTTTGAHAATIYATDRAGQTSTKDTGVVKLVSTSPNDGGSGRTGGVDGAGGDDGSDSGLVDGSTGGNSGTREETGGSEPATNTTTTRTSTTRTEGTDTPGPVEDPPTRPGGSGSDSGADGDTNPDRIADGTTPDETTVGAGDTGAPNGPDTSDRATPPPLGSGIPSLFVLAVLLTLLAIYTRHTNPNEDGPPRL